jgi:beta-barrel assembly-enhancing protease
VTTCPSRTNADHWVFTAKGALMVFLVSTLVLGAVAPVSASLFRAHLTNKEERELGKKFMLYTSKSLPLVDDPYIVGYVKKLGHYIVDQVPSPPFDFHFYVVNEEVYNAFAGPGGYIFLYTGLIAAMESEEELAGILGHEIAHVSARHISKRIEQAKKINIATMAGVLAGVFLGGGSAAGAVSTTSLAAGQSLSLKYSRENEIEADQLGLKYLTKAGYGGQGLLNILRTIREKQWFTSKEIPSYLSTHPAVEDRMIYLDSWIQANPDWKPSVSPPTFGDFDKFRTKVIGLYSNADVVGNIFDAAMKADASDAWAYYGKGLVLGRKAKTKEAVEYLKNAVQLRPLDVDILRDLGKAYFDMGDYPAALNTLKGVLAFDSNDPEGRLYFGRAQLKTNNLYEALETFKTLCDKHPDYAPGMYSLGETYGKLGNLDQAHYHLGMYYKHKGRENNARFHLQKALELSSRNPERQETIREALQNLSDEKKDGSSG